MEVVYKMSKVEVTGHDLHDETQIDGGVVIVPIQRGDNMLKTQLDGFPVQEYPPDDGGDEFLDAEVVSSFDDEDKYCVAEDRFIDVANMSEKKERAETPATVRSDHVHEALADQEGHDDHVAAASQDNVDGAEEVPDVERQTKPKKPLDDGHPKLKRIGPALLKTGFMLLFLMMMMRDTCGDDNQPHTVEDRFMYVEEDHMSDVGTYHKEHFF